MRAANLFSRTASYWSAILEQVFVPGAQHIVQRRIRDSEIAGRVSDAAISLLEGEFYQVMLDGSFVVAPSETGNGVTRFRYDQACSNLAKRSERSFCRPGDIPAMFR